MAILVRTMRHLDLESLLASESDILDGLARSVQHNAMRHDAVQQSGPA
jgi:hypothetical protein